MALAIQDTILDEEFRATQTGSADDHDVSVATFDASAFKTSVDALSLNLLSPPTGFPQYAEKTNFVSSTNQVTNYFLTSNGSGDPFPAGGTATTLFVGSNQIFLFATADSNIVVGRVGNGTTADPAGAVAIVIGIEETLSGGFVTSADMWLVQRAPIVQDGQNLVDNLDELDLTGLVYLGSDFDTTAEIPFSDFSDVPSGANAFDAIFPTGVNADLQLLVTGVQGETLRQVQVSTQGIGAGGQHVENGTSVRIDTVNGFIQSNVDSNSECVASAIDYVNHVNIVDASFQITQTNPAHHLVDVNIAAFQVSGDAHEQAFLDNAIATDGAPVQIDVADVHILNAAGTDITGTFGGTITAVGDTIKVTNLANTMQVKFSTDGVPFDRMLITNVDTKDTFDVGNIKVTSLVGGSDTEFAEVGSKLIYQDDGPNITASGSTGTALTADDSTLGTDPSGSFAGLFNAPDYGADVPASSTLQYILGISASGANSGLFETSSGDAVFLFLESGKVVGRSGDDATLAASGPVVFEISVDSNGTITLDEQSAVVHPTNPDADESTSAMAASLITITATVSDSEAANQNDSASAAVEIGNKFLFKDDGPTITGQPGGSATPNDLEVANTNGASDSSAYTLAPGADGLKSFFIVGPPDSSGDFTWQYFDVDGVNGVENNEIMGFYKGSALYTLELEDNGTYEFNMIGTLPSSELSLDTSDIKAGAPNTNSIDVGALNSTNFVRIAAGGGAVNESNAFVGVANGNLDVGESLTFTLREADADPINFNGISIGTKSAQASVYNWSATPVGGGPAITGTESVAKNGTILIDPDDLGDVQITSVTVTKVSGSATKIGLGDIDILVPPNDVQLGFSVRETDGDNDFVGQSFTVDIDGNLDGVFSANVNALSLPVAHDNII